MNHIHEQQSPINRDLTPLLGDIMVVEAELKNEQEDNSTLAARMSQKEDDFDVDMSEIESSTAHRPQQDSDFDVVDMSTSSEPIKKDDPDRERKKIHSKASIGGYDSSYFLTTSRRGSTPKRVRFEDEAAPHLTPADSLVQPDAAISPLSIVPVAERPSSISDAAATDGESMTHYNMAGYRFPPGVMIGEEPEADGQAEDEEKDDSRKEEEKADEPKGLSESKWAR